MLSCVLIRFVGQFDQWTAVQSLSPPSPSLSIMHSDKRVGAELLTSALGFRQPTNDDRRTTNSSASLVSKRPRYKKKGQHTFSSLPRRSLFPFPLEPTVATIPHEQSTSSASRMVVDQHGAKCQRTWTAYCFRAVRDGARGRPAMTSPPRAFFTPRLF